MSATKEERRISATEAPLMVPRTPLESRQGLHPKSDALVWKSPPTRQLSREKRLEYECDIRERFYDDYIGQRNTGDVGTDVLTGVHHLKFDPAIYRANALQGLMHDPARVVPSGVDFGAALKAERTRERQRHIEEQRRRRLSDSHLLTKPPEDYSQQFPPRQHKLSTSLPPIERHAPERPRSALQKSLDGCLNPTIAPKVENWLSSASKGEQEAAEKFFNAMNSNGMDRAVPDPKAAMRYTRARSAVMTPSQKQRHETDVLSTFEQLKTESKVAGKHPRRSSKPTNAQPEMTPVTKGSMFSQSTHQQPSHFTIHPQWASEANDPSAKKLK
ncbi:hypothetical protein EMCRGX_G022037 [Ephydatia muelleri]|eukprot:Em0009g682a